jgi:geranylgeranyl diphosphate synthase type I
VTQLGRIESTFPAALTPFAALVDERIRTLLDAESARWHAVDPTLAAPFDALRQFVGAGGKRLRPSFCYCAFVGAGGSAGSPAVVDAAAALELVHTFALVHDDVMDGSRTRRGRTAVHEHFAREHSATDSRGEARRYGDGMAILIGDFAVVYADMLMRDAPTAAHEIFDELRIELCVGQLLDLMGTAAASTDASTAHRIARYKSGKYTVERPLHLGAALAGRLDAYADALSAFGLPLGQAFQLRDDVLGAFGIAEHTGKPVGDDLREGKPTPLVALAYERASAADHEVLARLGSPALDEDDIRALQAVFTSTGALDEVEAEIARLVAEAQSALATADLTAEATAWLAELAEYVAWRDR